MFYLFLGLYTIAIIIVWGFFIIAKIHAYKFKNFSPHIKKVTFGLTISLAIMSIIGYSLIFMSKSKFDSSILNINSNTNNSIIEVDTDLFETDNDTDTVNYNY